MLDRGGKKLLVQLCANKCCLSPPNRQAKRLLNEIVEQCRYGPGFHCDMDGNGSIQQILIPANKVGLVIGKKGETIKQLQVWDVAAFVSHHICNILLNVNVNKVDVLQNNSSTCMYKSTLNE